MFSTFTSLPRHITRSFTTTRRPFSIASPHFKVDDLPRLILPRAIHLEPTLVARPFLWRKPLLKIAGVSGIAISLSVLSNPTVHCEGTPTCNEGASFRSNSKPKRRHCPIRHPLLGVFRLLPFPLSTNMNSVSELPVVSAQAFLSRKAPRPSRSSLEVSLFYFRCVFEQRALRNEMDVP